jgi:hypothetical protein
LLVERAIESAIRSSVRRLQSAGQVFVYHLHDKEHGVRRLYITADTSLMMDVGPRTLAELLIGM